MTFPTVIALNGTWDLLPVATFQQGAYAADTAAWLKQELPAHWQQHPYFANYAGRMVYRRQFAAPPAAGPTARHWLRINGAFYWSHPYLNGVDLGRNEGYCFAHEHEVTPWLAADNTLLIEVECPYEPDTNQKRMISGLFAHWDAVDPAINPGGLWLPVELISSGPIRIGHVHLSTHTIGDAAAELRFRVTLDSSVATDATLRWIITPLNVGGTVQTIEQPRALAAGTQELAGMLSLRDPQLWWTHDLGDPALYQVRLEVLAGTTLSDVRSFRFGVRTFELRDWVPHLNGRRMFVRGANYPPTDMRLATVTAEQCAADLRLAVDCNMNMLRVCSHIGHPALLDAADEAGVLIWQDLPFQWLYRRDVLPEAERQTRQIVQQHGNHPSIALWCMHNEPIYSADPRNHSRIEQLRSYVSVFAWSWNRDRLDTHLQQVVRRLDPTRPAVRSSGEFGVPLLRDGTDAHFYYGWYPIYGSLRQWAGFIRALPDSIRFVSEFGAQSFPNAAQSARFMPAEIDAIDWDLLARRHAFQPDVMANWIDWRAARSLDELAELSQAYQIQVNRYYIDRLRFHKYRPTGGVLMFMLHDAAPAVSWSVVDYWREPKRSYAALRTAFSAQYLFSLVEDETAHIGEPLTIPIYLINDARHAAEVAVIAQLNGPAGDRGAGTGRAYPLPADSMALEIERLRLTPTSAGEYRLLLTWQTAAGGEQTNLYTVAVTSGS